MHNAHVIANPKLTCQLPLAFHKICNSPLTRRCDQEGSKRWRDKSQLQRSNPLLRPFTNQLTLGKGAQALFAQLLHLILLSPPPPMCDTSSIIKLNIHPANWGLTQGTPLAKRIWPSYQNSDASELWKKILKSCGKAPVGPEGPQGPQAQRGESVRGGCPPSHQKFSWISPQIRAISWYPRGIFKHVTKSIWFHLIQVRSTR